MSEFRAAIADIVADREPGTQEQCRNLVTGRRFLAEYEEITRLDLVTDLGDDAREAARIYVRDPSVANSLSTALRSNQQIEIILYGTPHVFTVIDRENNPGNPQVMFKLKYNVPGKDP